MHAGMPVQRSCLQFQVRSPRRVERAAEIERTIERISKLEPERVAEEQKVREERLAELKLDFESSKRRSSMQSAAFGLRTRRTLASDAKSAKRFATWNKEWKTPTRVILDLGHPSRASHAKVTSTSTSITWSTTNAFERVTHRFAMKKPTSGNDWRADIAISCRTLKLHQSFGKTSSMHASSQ